MISSLIDTIRVLVDLDHRPWISDHQRLNKAGKITKINTACASQYRRFSVVGEHGTNVTAWSIKDGTQLLIEGSPSKYLTGQNVFGSENLQGLVLELVRTVCRVLGIRPTRAEKHAVRDGLVLLRRLDLATHIQFESDAQCENFIKAMKLQLAFGHRYFSAYGNETLYINQHSDMQTLKIYNKGRELQVHPLPRDLPNRDYVERMATGTLRAELTLRRRYLVRQKIAQVCDWDPANGRALLQAAVAGLKLRNVQLAHYEHVPALSNHANTLLAAHMAGTDVETIVRSSRSLKIHALAIVKATGINMYVPFVAQAASSAATTDIQSLAERLQFGTNAKARALGITDALPQLPTAPDQDPDDSGDEGDDDVDLESADDEVLAPPAKRRLKRKTGR